MDGFLKPFTSVLELVERYGYRRSLFALALLAILVAAPVYFGQQFLTGGEDGTDDGVSASPPKSFDPGPQIERQLETIRDFVRGDDLDVGVLVITLEWYRADGLSEERGIDLNGSADKRFLAPPTSGVPQCALERFGRRFPQADPTGQLFRNTEIAARDGFVAVPDTTSIKIEAPGLACVVGDSYYLLAGYDDKFNMILSVAIFFFGPDFDIDNPKLDFAARDLTDTELLEALREVPAIVALIEEEDESKANF